MYPQNGFAGKSAFQPLLGGRDCHCPCSGVLPSHTQHLGTNGQCDKHGTQRTEHQAAHNMQDTQVKNGRREREVVLVPQRTSSSGKEHSILQEIQYTQHQFLDHTHTPDTWTGSP